MIAWWCKAPTIVRLFSNLMLMEKVLTHDELIQRGIHCDIRCVVCSSGKPETVLHLFVTCQYAQIVWHLITSFLKVPLMVPGVSVQQTWCESQRQVKLTGKMDESTWATWFQCTCWMLWKQRNRIIFRGERMPPQILVKRIRDEGRLWLLNCQAYSLCCHSCN